MKLFAAFNSDGYKLGHGDMYSAGTNKVYSNLTPRTDKIHRQRATRFYDGKLVFVGAQGAIAEIVENWDAFFNMNKEIALTRFKTLCDNYLGVDSVPTEALGKLHDLGYLPLDIKTLEEGTKVPMGVPVLTITNTVDHAYWLVNFLETTLSNLTWKTSTSATIAGEYRAMLDHFAIATGSPLAGVDFQAHDFSARGMSGPEDAARSGFGHLPFFLGTDSLGSILYAQEYYAGGNFVAASVPATEHAVATSNILRIEQELNTGTYTFICDEQFTIAIAMRNNGEDIRLIAEMMFLYELIKANPNGYLSYVTDSFDFYGVLTRGLPYMVDVIKGRNGKLVIRPDSGDPETVLCGMKPVVGSDGKAINFASFGELEAAAFDEDQIDLCLFDCVKVDGVFYRIRDNDYGPDIDKNSVYEYAAVAGALRLLGKVFGTSVNEKGYKELDPSIGLIYGDSITTTRCLSILERMESQGWASGNVVFGVGSFTYQCNTRDTFAFAVKATYTEVNGVPVVIFKDPKTDSKKKSAKGLLFVGVDVETGEYQLIDNVTRELEAASGNALVSRFYNGMFLNQTSLDKIREIVKQ